MIQRALEKKLLSDIKPQKVVLLLGARRVGKTVLMEKLIREYGDGVVFLNGEDYATVEMLSARTISSYKQL
ncbi:MAG: AAA family ATPase, partial [Bacteroidales bacterium]|nr:AAA family ATPase [Bacteroidales bacterium]